MKLFAELAGGTLRWCAAASMDLRLAEVHRALWLVYRWQNSAKKSFFPVFSRQIEFNILHEETRTITPLDE